MALDPVISIVGKIGECLVEPIGRQLGYLIHYSHNIENLRKQVEKLEGLRNGVQESIDAAKRNLEIIRNDVGTWIASVDGIKAEAERFFEDDDRVKKRCFYGWFPNLTLRYQLSREAKRKAGAVTTLQEDCCKFGDNVSNPAPPPGIQFMSSRDFTPFETTKLAMVNVMEALKDDKINLIGIHGMGGVGKTISVKEIGKKAKELNLFDEVLIAVVSQTPDLKMIQDQIADMLGLTFNERSDFGRRARLCARLKDVKRILIILDDVWDKIELADIGIPFGNDHEGCKIIITTRRKQVCSAMGVRSQTTQIIHLGVLSEQESWDLFKRNAGDVIYSPVLKAVAEEVARECRGLPIALVTVGRAMREKNDPEEWKEAAQELKKAAPTNIEGVDQDVYKCLKLSYDYLGDEEAKSCFMLCSLFPEDHDILIENLVRYGMGLGIFKNVDTMQDARRRAHSVINNLKASCLLLASVKDGCIKMHDVVRDVAISIGSYAYLVRAGVNLKECPKGETWKNYTGISLMNNQIPEYPDAWECPKLQILLMQRNHIGQDMPKGVFKGMKELKVLDWSLTSSKMKLEPSFCYLTNLRTLILEGCGIYDTVALGEIQTLETLSFRGCKFWESPSAIGCLSNLRLLDLSGCRHGDSIPDIIPANVISSLTRLEELYMDDATSSWTVEGRHSASSHPSIAELKSLHRLTVLTTQIQGMECIPEDFVFPDWENFKISIGWSREGKFPAEAKCLKLSPTLGTWRMPFTRLLICTKALLQRTTYLSLWGLKGLSNILPELSFYGDGLNVLKTLEVEEFDELEYLINTEEWRGPPHGFSNLENLCLAKLRNFKGICHGVLPLDGSLSLSKLKELKVDLCFKLSCVLLPFDLLRRLPELEILQVIYCQGVKNMFNLEVEGPINVVEERKILSKLRELRLEGLEELKHIWKGPNQLVHPCNLRVVAISECKKLKNLFQPAIARKLEQLEELEVKKCDEVEEIVAKEQEGQEEASVDSMVFPRLKKLNLWNLPILIGFCTGSFPFEWPSLEEVVVWDCHNMKTFAASVSADGIQSTPKLKKISLGVHAEKMLDGKDLNTVIQNHFKEKGIFSTQTSFD